MDECISSEPGLPVGFTRFGRQAVMQPSTSAAVACVAAQTRATKSRGYSASADERRSLPSVLQCLSINVCPQEVWLSGAVRSASFPPACRPACLPPGRTCNRCCARPQAVANLLDRARRVLLKCQGRLALPLVHSLRTTAHAVSGAGRREAGVGSLPDEVALELG